MRFTFDKDTMIKEISIAQEIISTKNMGSILSNILIIAQENKLTIKATQNKQTTTMIQTIAPTHQVTIVWHTQSGRASTSRKQKKMLKHSTNKLHLT